MTHVNPRLEQYAQRGVADDGVFGSGTWKAAQNTGWTQNVDENFRVRIGFEEDAGASISFVVGLQYNLNGTGYVEVSATSNVVRVSASPHEIDQASDIERLTGFSAATWWGAVFDEVDGRLNSFSLNNQRAEGEFCVQIRSADVVNGDTITFRLWRPEAGIGLDSYVAGSEPTVTVSETAPGPQTVTLDRIDHARNIFGVTLAMTTLLPRVDHLREIFGVSLEPGPVVVSPSRVDHPREIFAPTLSVGPVVVSLDRVDHLREIFAPTIAVAPLTIALDRVDHQRIIFDPTISVVGGEINILLDRVDHVREIFGVALGMTISLPLVEHLREIFAPTLVVSPVDISLDRVDHLRDIFGVSVEAGSVLVSLDRVDHLREIFAPIVAMGPVSVALDRVDHDRQIFAPTLSAGSVTITLERVDHQRIIFAPIIGTPPVEINDPSYGFRGQDDQSQVVDPS